MTITSDLQVQKVVIVQDSVVYPFTCGAFRIEFPVPLAVSRDSWEVSEVTVGLDVDSPPVVAGRAFVPAIAGRNSSAGKGATVFLSLFPFVIAPGAHFFTASAMGMTELVNGNILRDTIAGLVPRIDIDESVDTPSVQ